MIKLSNMIACETCGKSSLESGLDNILIENPEYGAENLFVMVLNMLQTQGDMKRVWRWYEHRKTISLTRSLEIACVEGFDVAVSRILDKFPEYNKSRLFVTAVLTKNVRIARDLLRRKGTYKIFTPTFEVANDDPEMLSLLLKDPHRVSLTFKEAQDLRCKAVETRDIWDEFIKHHKFI